MTAYQKLHGKAWPAESIEFGSLIHHRAPGKTAGGSLQARWLPGVYLGTCSETLEHYCGLDQEDVPVVRAGAAVPIPEESRWCKDRVLAVSKFPVLPHPRSRTSFSGELQSYPGPGHQGLPWGAQYRLRAGPAHKSGLWTHPQNTSGLGLRYPPQAFTRR